MRQMFVISQNLMRRHLTATQCAQLAAELLDVEKARTKARESERKKGLPSRDGVTPGRSAAKVAKQPTCVSGFLRRLLDGWHDSDKLAQSLEPSRIPLRRFALRLVARRCGFLSFSHGCCSLVG
jgi:hypothetical protein